MNLPLLIIGGEAPSRKEKAFQEASQNSSTFDTTVLDAKETSGIADVRDLIYKFSRRPFESSFQTFCLLEAQNLTQEAQNALLKTLEETPSSSKIILTAPTAESLLSTITSRCQTWQLAPDKENTFDLNLLQTYLNVSFYERYKLADRLDLDSWISAWRQILLNLFVADTKKIPIQANQQKILAYIKLITKLKSLQKRKASSKLIKTIILLETPPLLVNSN
ncbi:MAG TPA: hypothetical protein VF303_03695 [Candidatus Nanoarchaeia archaeon]